MQHKPNAFQSILIVLAMITFSSCENSDDLTVNSADFNVSSKTVYLNETITLEAKDTLGYTNYIWDFGDGTSCKDGAAVSHQYNEAGNFTASLTINGLHYSQKVEVLPGRFSYQIANNSNIPLNVLTYINNYEDGDVKRMDIGAGSETDTIFAESLIRFSELSLLGISIFVENSEYTLVKPLLLKEFEHHFITIDDETELYPRSSHGIPSGVLLKDLYTLN